MRKIFFVCLLIAFAFTSSAQKTPESVFAKKDDVDFSFIRKEYSARTFKYYIIHDTVYLRAAGADYRLPLTSIDFETSDIVEDVVIRNGTGNPTWAVRIKPKEGYKFHDRSGDQLQGVNEPSEIDEVWFNVPDKVFAKKVKDYLKALSLKVKPINIFEQ